MQASEPTLPQLWSLRGRRVVLTGGCGHLGAAMARGLAEAGASVVLTSRDADKAAAAAARLPRLHEARHHGLSLDHLAAEQLPAAFQEIIERCGPVDVLVNNGHAGLKQDWTTVTADQFTQQLANASGYFQLARLFREHLVGRQSGGVLILLGSMYGLVGSYPDAYADLSPASSVAYHTLKGGIVQMTRHLAVYWASDQIRVNCLSPGPFPSPQVAPELVERLSTKSPLGRMGQPHELKGAIVFLASDASSYLTGHNLVVDGGWTAW